MQGKAWKSVLIVLALSITGCIGASDETDEPIKDAGLPGGELPANATVAPDGRGDISAFKETNKTETGAGGMVHAHDYWEGKERLDDVMWIDAGLIPFPLFPCKKEGNGCTLGPGVTSDTYPAATAIADFDFAAPPSMGMVYEGTKQVEVNMVKFTGPEGQPANPAGKVYFDYMASNDEPGKFRKGGELKLNEPFLIDIAPTDADMPHQTKSLWIFRIYSNSEMVWFEFNITISLVRGYDVVNWPPHPDLYGNGPTRTVFEGPVKLQSKGSVDGILFGSDAGWLSPQKVISWGTDKVDVKVTNVKFTPDTPVAPPPKGFVLELRNASTPFLMANGVAYGARLEDPASSGTDYSFTIDLTSDRGDAMDTPYAQFSRWGFRLVPYWEGSITGRCIDEEPIPVVRPGGIFPGILFGCQWYGWTMTYDMKIVATGRSTAG